jgi:hypothetical protein
METNNKEIIFNIPTGYEIDKERTTDKQVVYKYKQQNVELEITEFLFELFNGLTIDLKYNTDYITYKKDGYIYLQYNLRDKCLYYNYIKIYSVLEKTYQIKDIDINKLVGCIVFNILKLKADLIKFC